MINICKTLYLLLIILTIVSCGSDDECLPEDIIGTYEGTVVCTDSEGKAVTENILLLIQNIDGDTYVAVDEQGDETTFKLKGCNVSIPEVEADLFGIMLKISGEGSFDGDQLNLEIDNEVDGETINCIYSTTKR